MEQKESEVFHISCLLLAKTAIQREIFLSWVELSLNTHMHTHICTHIHVIYAKRQSELNFRTSHEPPLPSARAQWLRLSTLQEC